MKKVLLKIGFAIIFLIIVYFPVSAQLSTCWKMIHPHDPANGNFNPDSVLINNCATNNGFDQRLAKKQFEIIIKGDVFGLPQLPSDSIVILSWENIIPNFASLRTSFKNLDSIYGSYYFIKKFPDIIDTNHLASHTYLIEFNSYINIDSVVDFITGIDGIAFCCYLDQVSSNCTILDDPSFIAGLGDPLFNKKYVNLGNTKDNFDGWLFGFSGKIFKEGYEWSKYEIKLPLAWELSKGYHNFETDPAKDAKNVVVAINDNFGVQPWVPSICTIDAEFLYFNTSEATDNLRNKKFVPYSSIKDNKDNNQKIYDSFFSGHGGAVSSVAITNGNNNIGMSGVAPNCSFVTSPQALSTQYLDISSDLGRQTVDVVNASYGNAKKFVPENQTDYKIRSGIVSVAGCGNNMFDSDLQYYIDAKGGNDDYLTFNDENAYKNFFKNYLNEKHQLEAYEDQLNPTNIYIRFQPKLRTPAGDAYYVTGLLKNPNNTQEGRYPDEFYKVIGVGGLSRENITSEEYNWDPRIKSFSQNFNENPVFKSNKSSAVSAYNYSRGATPFSGYSNNEKLANRSNAQIDVVAPAMDILSLRQDGLMYNLQTGTSHATPQVSGVVALMCSINKNLGLGKTVLNLEKYESIHDGAPIHKKAYDIITFTADKILDNNDPLNKQDVEISFTAPPPFSIKVFWDYPPYRDNNNDIQYNYVVQNDDPMKRSYAQRVGFGKINAYRCLAHSISLKGTSVYSSTTPLSITAGVGNTNQEGYTFMHWGAYNSNGELLWSYDADPLKQSYTLKPGDKFDNEPDYINNNGTTKISGVATAIAVATNPDDKKILAIDGILKQENTTLSNVKVHETKNMSKILINGYLKDVELNGRIKMHDLKVYSSSIQGFGRITINCTNTDYSELYGEVTINNHSKIELFNGTLKLQPGSCLTLNGSSPFIIKNGSILEMCYGSSIVKGPDAIPGPLVGIIVKNGAKIKVPAGVATEINCPILIEPGGEVIFEENTFAYIDSIALQGPGSILTLSGEDKIGVWLFPAKDRTGKISLGNGSSLRIFKNSTKTDLKVMETAILGGLDVYGKLTVDHYANFAIGAINSYVGSTIDIKKGSNITFIKSQNHIISAIGTVNNYINGDFNIEDRREFIFNVTSSTLIPPPVGSIYLNNGSEFTVESANINSSGAGQLTCYKTNGNNDPALTGVLIKNDDATKTIEYSDFLIPYKFIVGNVTNPPQPNEIYLAKDVNNSEIPMAVSSCDLVRSSNKFSGSITLLKKSTTSIPKPNGNLEYSYGTSGDKTISFTESKKYYWIPYVWTILPDKGTEYRDINNNLYKVDGVNIDAKRILLLKVSGSSDHPVGNLTKVSGTLNGDVTINSGYTIYSTFYLFIVQNINNIPYKDSKYINNNCEFVIKFTSLNEISGVFSGLLECERVSSTGEPNFSAGNLTYSGGLSDQSISYSQCTPFSNVTTIRGLEGDNKFKLSDNTDNFVLANILLRNQGNDGKISNVHFINTVINQKINDVYYESIFEFENCLFQTNSKILHDNNLSYNAFINYDWDRIMPYNKFENPSPLSNLSDKYIKNCRFIDNNPDGNAYDYNEGVKNYPNMKGIFIDHSRNTVIIDNTDQNHEPHFLNLGCGIWTEVCNRVEVYNNHFSKCDVGSLDICSSYLLCHNTFKEVKLGSEFDMSKDARIYNNTYSDNRYSNRLDYNATGVYRYNTFSDYWRGIYNVHGDVWLRSRGDDDKWGRNIFNMPNPINPYTPTRAFIARKPFPPDLWVSDYSGNTNINDKGTNSDIYLKNGILNQPSIVDSKLFISDPSLGGMNRMGDWSTYHIYNENPNSYNLTTEYNNYRVNSQFPNPVNRFWHVTPDPFQNNTTEDSQNNLTELSNAGCEDKIQGLILNNPYPCQYFSYNHFNWIEYSPDSLILDEWFVAALQDFCDGSEFLTCDCVMKRLEDALQSATLGDSTTDKLLLLRACIQEKIADTNLICPPKNEMMMFLAEINERLNAIDSALSVYYRVIELYPTLNDTMHANWRILRLNAILSDTTFGAVYDSLIGIYYDRVVWDITKLDTSSNGGGGSQPPPPPPMPKITIGEQNEPSEQILQTEENALAVLEQNAPNPFTNETVIVFRLNREADVRLGVHDALGHTIKEVLNQRLRKGKYIYTFQNDNLTTGVYLYLLTTDGKQIMKKMQLVK